MELTFDHKETLRVLASISTIAERNTIRERNLFLKEKLLLLEPYIGQCCCNIPDDILEEVIKKTYEGCPHCDYCKKCKWFQALSITNKEGYTIEHLIDFQRNYTIRAGCYLVGFGPNNITLEMVSILPTIGIRYANNEENIKITKVTGNLYTIDFEKKLSAEDFSKCMEFVQGHLDWTDLECWGSECPD